MRFLAVVLLTVYFTFGRNCEAMWTQFASSYQYLNTQMVTELTDFFPLKLTPKNKSAYSARIDCSFACKHNESCLAFNFYETETSYACELLPDNFCSNRVRKALVPRNGSSVWDKLPENVRQSCVVQKFGQNSISCEFLQPGCLGTWPNCYDCVNSCDACFARGFGSQKYKCTFWPEKNVPVFGICQNRQTSLSIRSVDMTNGYVTDYRMRFSDIYRLYKLQIYTTFRLYFGATDNSCHLGFYADWAINENGTLLGYMTYVTPDWGISTDILNVTGRLVDRIPFVEVADDRYGCGPFWLLDDTNSTYCPGGQTSMFGAVQRDSQGYVTDTGIKVASVSPTKVFSWATVELGF